MRKVTAVSPGGVPAPSEDGVGAHGAEHPGSATNLAHIASVGEIEAGFFGSHVDSDAYRLEFERAIIRDAGSATAQTLVGLFDATFAPINHKGDTNIPATAQSLVAAMEYMHSEDPWSYAPMADRFAAAIVQPSSSVNVSHEQAIQTRLANWTQGLEPEQADAIRLAVAEKQNASRPAAPTNWASAAPALNPAVAGLLFSVGVGRV